MMYLLGVNSLHKVGLYHLRKITIAFLAFSFFGTLTMVVKINQMDQRGEKVKIKRFNEKEEELILSAYIQDVQDKARRRMQSLQNLLDHPRPPDSEYNLNATLSDILPLVRDLSDTRPTQCVTKHNMSSRIMKTTSVIITFHNECPSMLLRTLHSILKRTPDDFLKEIILIDDASSNSNLHDPLKNHLKFIHKVKLVRNIDRVGLIRSRNAGAMIATGDVIVFFDAHIEVNRGWLEPLLAHLETNANAVVQPVVENIHPWTLEYSKSERMFKGGFKWDLTYVWMEPTERDRISRDDDTANFRSATLVGCAVAMLRKTFFNYGKFDHGMAIWGGENIELAFRFWMCGGEVLTVPCSRVGHVFKPFSYTFNGGDREKIIAKNLMRIAEVWMDKHKIYFYAALRAFDVRRTSFTKKDIQSMNERKFWISKNLKCHSFKWFLDEIIPEINVPPMDAKFFGEIRNKRTDFCFETFGSFITLTSDCYFYRSRPSEEFVLDTNGRLKHVRTQKCVTIELSPIPPSLMKLQLNKCSDSKHFIWEFHQEDVTLGSLRVKVVLEDGKGESVYCIIHASIEIQHDLQEQPDMPMAGNCAENDEAWFFGYNMDYAAADLPIVDEVDKNGQPSKL